MSTEAVKWAMDDAPMLHTDKGKPDTSARYVLWALAEHARPDGTNSHPSNLRLQYRTGLDDRTVQRALRRLEKAGLITKTGTVQGRTKWRLVMNLKRPEFDWAELEAENEERKRATADRVRRHRAKRVTHSDDVTETHSDDVTESDVTHSEGVSNALEVRYVTHSDDVRNALSAALTTNNHQSNHQEELPSQEAQPADEHLGYGIPDAARPLVDGLTAAGVVVRWPFKGDGWFPLLGLISKSGVPALIDHATKAAARATEPIDSARYFMRGWSELPPLPPPDVERPPLRAVKPGGHKPFQPPTDPSVYANGF